MSLRVRAYGVCAVVLLALLWPLSFAYPDDGYPFSSFPMFAYGRESPVIGVTHVLAVGDDGQRRPVAPPEIGTRLVMQSLSTIARAVARDGGVQLCERVAQRVAARRTAYGNPRVLQVVTSDFDVTEYFAASARSREPKSRKVHATCAVPGAP